MCDKESVSASKSTSEEGEGVGRGGRERGRQGGRDGGTCEVVAHGRAPKHRGTAIRNHRFAFALTVLYQVDDILL